VPKEPPAKVSLEVPAAPVTIVLPDTVVMLPVPVAVKVTSPAAFKLEANTMLALVPVWSRLKLLLVDAPLMVVVSALSFTNTSAWLFTTIFGAFVSMYAAVVPIAPVCDCRFKVPVLDKFAVDT
jgi:hypothetical protein